MGKQECVVNFMDSLNRRSRKLGMLEWKMAQGAAACLAVIALKLFPGILRIDLWVLVVVAALLYIRPLYMFWVDS